MSVVSHPSRCGRAERCLSGAGGLLRTPRAPRRATAWPDNTGHTHTDMNSPPAFVRLTGRASTGLFQLVPTTSFLPWSLGRVYTQTNILLTGWSGGLVDSWKSLALEQQKVLCTPRSRLLNLR